MSPAFSKDTIMLFSYPSPLAKIGTNLQGQDVPMKFAAAVASAAASARVAAKEKIAEANTEATAVFVKPWSLSHHDPFCKSAE